MHRQLTDHRRVFTQILHNIQSFQNSLNHYELTTDQNNDSTMSPEATEGIKPVIEALQDGNIIEQTNKDVCISPIFPVKKASTGIYKWYKISEQ